MQLSDLLARAIPPEPWAEADNIPWHEPAFSARMLREHLSQEHDAASRRAATIDRHVAWLHRALLAGRPAQILDLGCGPGLYTSRLARLGHRCVGIDYSPASIAYARAAAAEQGLACRYEQADLREADLGAGVDLALLIFGELNIFRPAHAAALLARVRAALAPGGALLLEAHTYAAVRAIGEGPPTWSTAAAGLFGDTPHLRLSEQFWRPADGVATVRHYIVAAAGAAVTRYAQSFQAYTDAGYAELLRRCGFGAIERHAALSGAAVAEQPELQVIVARP